MLCGEFLFHLLVGSFKFIYSNSITQIIVLGRFGGP